MLQNEELFHPNQKDFQIIIETVIAAFTTYLHKTYILDFSKKYFGATMKQKALGYGLELRLEAKRLRAKARS